MLLRALLVASLTLTLSACSVFSPEPEPVPADPQLSWQEHLQRLEAINSWEITGKVGIRSSETRQSANLAWQQQQDVFNIELSGPLGQGGAKISGSPNGIEIHAAGEEPIYSPYPELLMEERLGWRFPLDNLPYWIKGQPAPDSPYTPVIAVNRLQSLEQNNWQINYLRYTSQDGISLPSKIVLNQGNLRITLIAKEWFLDQP